jgi:cell division protein FtsB
VERERQQVERLKVVVDSLQGAAKAIQTDPRVQERVAREAFGMIRRGEYLYRIVAGDTGRRLEEGSGRR